MELYKRPFCFATNKTPYLISGGTLINRFLGLDDDAEPRTSQLWIASTVQSVLDNATDSCSCLTPEDGGACFPELLESAPSAYLGPDHARTFGPEPAMLLKLLNSDNRLLVQVHPTRDKAQRYFEFPFGKTEAWYVLETEGKAFVWAGFVPGVTLSNFRRLIEAQDSERILACLHRFSIKKGDLIRIPAGLPHAMGAGSLVAEIQEPSDITLRAERFRPDGVELPEYALHSGIGMDGLLDCFDFSPLTSEETRKRIFHSPRTLFESSEGRIQELIDSHFIFSLRRVECNGNLEGHNDSFVVGLSLAGRGSVRGNGYVQPLNKGSEFFLPHGVKEYVYSGEKLVLLECRVRPETTQSFNIAEDLAAARRVL